MLRKMTLALGFALIAAASSQAALLGSFRQTATNQTTNALVYSGNFDTWVFEVRSTTATSAGNIDSLSLSFASPGGGFLNTKGGTAFQNGANGGASNPLVFGFVAPETFLTFPGSGNPLAVGTVDTNNALSSDYTTDNNTILVPNTGAKVPVAFFSLASGGNLGQANFLAGSGVASGGSAQLITFENVPEPTTIALLGLSLVGGFGFIRRRCA